MVVGGGVNGSDNWEDGEHVKGKVSIGKQFRAGVLQGVKKIFQGSPGGAKKIEKGCYSRCPRTQDFTFEAE